MGPPTMQDSMAERRNMLAMQDKIRIARMQALTSRLNHPGAIPENRYLGGEGVARDAMDLRDLRDMRGAATAEYGAINDAMAPVQKVQSPAEIVAGRAGISAQLGQELLRQKIAAARARGEQPNYDALVAESGAAANAALPNYTGGVGQSQGLEDQRVTDIRQKQAELAARQQQNREQQAQFVSERLTGPNIAAEQFMRESGMAGRELARTQMQEKIAQSKASLASAQSEADPQYLEALKTAKVKAAQAGALQSQAQFAEQQAKLGGSLRTAATGDPDYLNVLNSVGTTVSRLGAGGYVGSETGGEIGSFSANVGRLRDYIESLPPDQQKVVKAHALQQLQGMGLTESQMGVLGMIPYTRDWLEQGVSPSARRSVVNQRRYQSGVNDLLKYLQT